MRVFRLLLVGGYLFGFLSAFAGPRDAEWIAVEKAMDQGRQKTAIALLDPIIEAALVEKAYPEAIKALARKTDYQTRIEGGRVEEHIRPFQAEIPNWPEDSRPILETILAHWYWSFFQQNQWRFMERTQTGAAPGEDILTWDLPRILGEIDSHFTAALSAGEVLREIPVGDYDDLLISGSIPDSYRPTLYDFVAHEALAFYSSGTQAGAKAQDAFVLRADSPAFGSIDDFIGWEIETTDEDSITAKGLRVFQDLLAFHRDDEVPDALLDADLSRLVFAMNHAVGEEEKKTRYRAALERFIEKWEANQISSRARALLASEIKDTGDFVKARAIAKLGWDAFPETPEGGLCANVVHEIEAPSAQLLVERVWNDPMPRVSVRYRNLKKVYFKVVDYSWDRLVRSGHWNVEQLERPADSQLLTAQALRSWQADLPETDDFQDREAKIEVPKNLESGFYFLVSSFDPNFKQEEGNQTNYAGFWVSDLALIVRTMHGDGKVEGFVLDAKSGDPIKGARVQGWGRNKDRKRVTVNSVKTDKNGKFTFTVDGKHRLFLASHDGERLGSMQDHSNHTRSHTLDPIHTYFFTDRAIYRPGQTIRYKGLSAKFDKDRNDYAVLRGRSVTVRFLDVNGKEIEQQTHTTNDYGSFHGSFTAPRDRLMGRMRISTGERNRHDAWVTVEEYKRPKFKVDIEVPKEAVKLGGEVEITGEAMAYTGAPIDNAQVSYRVVREVRYPDWWGWYSWRYPSKGSESQEIDHGTVQTGANGKFTVKFKARPDLTVPVESEPVFQFRIDANVTDSAGETRSDSGVVNVGYTALRATLGADPWQEKDVPVKLTVGTSSHDGEARAATGTVKVHRLKEPDKVHRARLNTHQHWRGAGGEGDRDFSRPENWKLGEVVEEKAFETKGEGSVMLEFALEPGHYRAVLETQDAFGKKVTALKPIDVLDPTGERFPLKIPYAVSAPSWTLEPGDDFNALWGTGYDRGRAFIEVVHRGKRLAEYWTQPGLNQALIERKVGEDLRGGFQLLVTMVRENRAYTTRQRIHVPWSQKKLEVSWERHRSNLEPGKAETWTAKVTGPDAEKAVAELAATLYDESLEAFLPHQWRRAFDQFYQDHYNLNTSFQNQVYNLNVIRQDWDIPHHSDHISHRHFRNDILPAAYLGSGGRNYFWKRQGMAGSFGGGYYSLGAVANSAPSRTMMAFDKDSESDSYKRLNGRDGQAKAKSERKGSMAAAPGGVGSSATGPNLDQVSARKNLNETAFFFPHLVSDADGSVKMEFTMPEALTSWKFMAFAHDKELRAGFLEGSAVTAKDIMVQPNPPRFLREGDILEFTVKVTNKSPTRQTGKVRLTLSDAHTLDSADVALGNGTPDQDFDIPAKESRSFSWRLSVPDGQGFLIYKAVASAAKVSDGEEGFLPVLPRRILVTESLPLPIRGAQTKTFQFDRLLDSAKSDTLRHESLTVQMVSNPAWYAVMALPYLMEYPHECSEQIFNRVYANSLGSHIANSDPKIERIFEQWRGGDALDSPLEKNQDLKAVMIEETPWLCQSENESQARRNVGILFDENRIGSELARARRKLQDRQYNDGAWPWFPGGRASEYITLYITTGFGRLRHLGVADAEMDLALRAVNYLDAEMEKRYRLIVHDKRKDENNLSATVAMYLYCRSFFLKDRPIADQHREGVNYFLGEARDHWLTVGRQSQGHVALALQRFEVHEKVPVDIVTSLREFSVSDEEMGMFWRDTELSWWWYRAPIETQALMIEVFDEVAKDGDAVEDLKVWLLKQKQTRDWKTTRATADATYGLLLRGADLLASDALVEVSLGGKRIEPETVEAGTGFYEQRFGKSEIKPRLGKVTVKKTDEGVAWGSLHWQYLETMEKITPYEGTPLTLKKSLYVKENTEEGPVLRPLEAGNALAVGDELTVRIELRVDRDMEYIHLKDQRGSGTEPMNVLSRYQYQDGLRYYESTRDTASHFFIDYLAKGTYVFEYSVRVFHRGEYQSGMAQIQCMYAPEFNSHSASIGLVVR